MKTSNAFRQLCRAPQQYLRPHHAPFRITHQLSSIRRDLHIRARTPSLACRHLPSNSIARQSRGESTDAQQRPLTERHESAESNKSQEAQDIAARKAKEPAYELTFTCRKCLHRSSHRVTKQAYHFGTTLITCPECKNRHLISDHLKIFSDKSVTIEDILKEKGQHLRKGRLGEDGDIEFYDENKETNIAEIEAEERARKEKPTG